MKNIQNYIICMAFLLFSFGCEDYLETTPDNRIEADSLEKLAELLVYAYPRADYLFTDWMTDDVTYISSNRQLPEITDAYEWKELAEKDDTNTPSNFWSEAYAAISQTNSVLDALESVKSNDTKFKNAVKGEALMCRAYAHFMLVSLFAKNYDEATASSDLGIPYVVKPEKVLIQDYKRGTLKETYDNIEKDLEEGLKLLSDDYYKGSKRYHFTKKAAYAFASRFYLYKKKYAESIKYANMILGKDALNTNAIKNIVEYGNQSGSVAKQLFYASSKDASNILIIEKYIGVGLRYYYGYRTSVSQWFDLFKKDKVFEGVDYRSDFMGYYGDGSRNTIKAAKFREEFYKKSLTATTGHPFFVQPVLRGAEVLFNRIESKIELGQLDGALKDLNEFGVLRYDKAAPISLAALKEYYSKNATDNTSFTEKEALMKLLLDEKRKEFLQEGMRWLDIKRHNLSVTHTTYEGETIVLKADDSRKVLQIPSTATSRGIQKNPR